MIIYDAIKQEHVATNKTVIQELSPVCVRKLLAVVINYQETVANYVRKCYFFRNSVNTSVYMCMHMCSCLRVILDVLLGS